MGVMIVADRYVFRQARGSAFSQSAHYICFLIFDTLHLRQASSFLLYLYKSTREASTDCYRIKQKKRGSRRRSRTSLPKKTSVACGKQSNRNIAPPPIPWLSLLVL